ncbi:LacI family DNA-binding transcriptional regulator [Schaalia sp. ZJ405]|uniref:LacI family DNA-binding transcriptional regulator n=1 Tax=unclassified Schaalia TaxID=2691889 RepID=UPI0013EB8D4C|nr:MULTISPECIES: LacI family DNA-binding transcriptional regulator [unclassified Schaalia]QPK81306.1 LacI family DNA-binding transcriptional regulator [Schaalia sp. ZJ405]
MSSNEPMRPRLIDVARQAEVSLATASRALGRGSELIAAKTRDHVRQVAQQMGYQVNPIARSLRLASTRQVGMVVPSISNPFFMELVVQVEHSLAERNRSLLLCDSRMSVANEDNLLRGFESGAVDGLIIAPCHETFSTPALERAAAHVPTVQLDRAVQSDTIPMVGVDDRHGTRTILTHVKELGAQSIAILSNTGSNLSSVTRNLQARECAEEFGLELADANVIACNFSVESAEAAVGQLIARGPLPDAIICLNDLLAIGAITALRRHDVAIPEDILVTGFDDIQFAQLMRPSVTTLRQPLQKIAQMGVDLLLGENPLNTDDASADSLAAHATSRRYTIPGKLIIRESTVLS